jgi:hypothetical protein
MAVDGMKALRAIMPLGRLWRPLAADLGVRRTGTRATGGVAKRNGLDTRPEVGLRRLMLGARLVGSEAKPLTQRRELLRGATL